MRASRSGQRHHDPHCKTQIATLHIGHSCCTVECYEEEFDIMEAANVPTITSSPCFPAQAGTEVPPHHHTAVLFLVVSRLVTAYLSAFAHRRGRAKLPANDLRPFAQLHIS
jgi:hypothetical protein